MADPGLYLGEGAIFKRAMNKKGLWVSPKKLTPPKTLLKKVPRPMKKGRPGPHFPPVRAYLFLFL